LLIALALLLAGLSLLMFGRVLWRAIAAALLAAVGAGVGHWVGQAAKMQPPWDMLVGAAVFAGLGIVLARVVWSFLLASTMAVAALWIVLRNAPPVEPVAGFAAADLALGVWAAEAQKALLEWLRWLVRERTLATVIGGGLAALTGLLIGMIRPAFARIVLSAVLGATMAVGGIALGVTRIREFDLWDGNRPWALLGIGAVLGLIGFGYQYRSELRGQRKSDDDTEAAPPPPKPKAKETKKK
jgi:hypothetical protein